MADDARLPSLPLPPPPLRAGIARITAWAQSAANEDLLATIAEASRELALRAASWAEPVPTLRRSMKAEM